MLQNTLMLGIFSISAYQDYKKRKINTYFLLTGGIIGLLLHLYSMKLDIVEILFGMGIGVMILFWGFLLGGGVGFADGMILVVSGIFLGFEKNMAMLLFLIVMKLGLQLYGETRTLAEDVIKEETLNALKLFYEIERVKGLF